MRSTAQWYDSDQTKEPLSFLMIDIDFFKKINDNYGHDCGDIVIQTVSQVLLEQTNEHDIVGRLGGEEFAVTMPHTSMDEAIQIAEKIRDAIEHTLINFNETAVSLTVSVGIATQTSDLYNFDAIVKLGDKNLYIAKHDGRNRVAY